MVKADARTCPLCSESDQVAAPPRNDAKCRLCCKSRKLQGCEFFAKIQNGKQSPIRITSIALPKSPVSFARGDEVPHIFTRNARLQPAEFLIIGAKRLLQHNLPVALSLPQTARYSITSSARASSEGGTLSPSILAVETLITSSNFAACTTGKSAGLAPLRIRPA